MKELNIQDQLIDKVKEEIIIQQKQEYKLVGSIRRRPGLTLFEFDFETMNIYIKKIQCEVSIGLDGKEVRKQKAVHNPNGILIWALNLKNAEKKVLKIFKEKGFDVSKAKFNYKK